MQRLDIEEMKAVKAGLCPRATTCMEGLCLYEVEKDYYYVVALCE